MTSPPPHTHTLYSYKFRVSFFQQHRQGNLYFTQAFLENSTHFSVINTLLLTAVQTAELFCCLLLETFLSPIVTIVNPVWGNINLDMCYYSVSIGFSISFILRFPNTPNYINKKARHEFWSPYSGVEGDGVGIAWPWWRHYFSPKRQWQFTDRHSVTF